MQTKKREYWIGVFRYNLGSFKSNSVTVDFLLAYNIKGNKQNKKLLSLNGILFVKCC